LDLIFSIMAMYSLDMQQDVAGLSL
jgi:hypothetical protein